MNKLFLVFALLVFTFCHAAPISPVGEDKASTYPEKNGETLSVFVHISAITTAKDGKKVAKISNITLANDQATPKKALKARLRKSDNLLQFEIQMASNTPDRFLMPKGFIINDKISKLLGEPGKVVMSGGTTMVKQKNGSGLLQFEIQ
jgi:hypothetical protein